MVDLTPVSPGEAFRFLNADVANALLEVARAWRIGALGPIGNNGHALASSGADPVSVVMQNRTGADLAQYAIVGISDALVPYATSATEFKRRPQFRATAPSASTPFAVLQQPLANWVSDSTPKTIGRAIISGCTVCKLNVTSSGDTYAAPTTSTTELTTQASPGPARILAKESGAGAGKWGLVLITNSAESASASLEYQNYQAEGTTISATTAVKTEVTSWIGFPDTGPTNIQFPSTGYWLCNLTVTGIVSDAFPSEADASAGSNAPRCPTLYALVSPADTNYVIQGTTSTVGGVVAHGGYQPHTYFGDDFAITVAYAFEDRGTTHFCFVVRANVANAKGLKLECWHEGGGVFSTKSAFIYGVNGLTPTHNIGANTQITLAKISEL